MRKFFCTTILSLLFCASMLAEEESAPRQIPFITDEYLEFALQGESSLGYFGSDDLIGTFLATNSQKFRSTDLTRMYNLMLGMSDPQLYAVVSANYKDPTIALVLSLLLGGLGIDRFYIGQPVAGVLKLITGGGFAVWTVIDWFLIMGATKDQNYNTFVSTASYAGAFSSQS